VLGFKAFLGDPGLADFDAVTPAELGGLILSGEFTLQLHIGALLLAGLRGFINLGTLKPYLVIPGGEP